MDGASSSSSSIPAKPASTSRWDVFLSFRGVDTRRGFTGHLLSSLDRKGINTFRDNLDLERGEEISDELMKAIEESMFALIILSPNYASSTWCLKELQKILECKKTFGQSVFPIFYGVDSSDVRHQRGSFAKAFGEHEEKFREDRVKVDRWRDALREVADYSGWDSKDWTEAALVETIAGQILKKLIPKLPSCTENLVGIDSRIKEVHSRLDMGLNDVRFIGIWGMGGIGKTTNARLVYEAIKGEFEVSCFLENIREKSDTNGLVHIQRELLNHLDIRNTDFNSSHDGKKILANSLRNKKFLLVLDDVSELSQLESLAGKQDWFGPRSRVIITTRDKQLLVTHDVHEICEAMCLENNEALELFCLKAFKQDHPEEEYSSLCKEVVEYTGGLPLALEVLGSHLRGRTVEIWHSALKQIRSVPHSKIQDTLKISYDSLEPQYKNLFLDIACFFKGKAIDEVIDILEHCGDDPKIGIEILRERSLVTLRTSWGDYKALEMHDLLQEMGRNIVFQESPNDPGRRSRLWSQKDIDQVLTKNTGTDKIQGIVLNSFLLDEARWSPEAFSKTTQLRLLMLSGLQLPFGLNCLPSALKVLHWSDCPLKTLPLTNQLDEIVDLKLDCSVIEQLWHGTKFLGNLKSIDLSCSENLKQSPDFAGVPNLESLNLEGCTSLTEVHPSLVRHKKLIVMDLRHCQRLKALPCKMEMSSLKDLYLAGCSEFKYLPEFGESMKNLSKLYLDGTAIKELPSSVGCLVGLTILSLKNCRNLVCLLDFGECMKNLSGLYLDGTVITELPSSLGCLVGLTILSLKYCKNLVCLPEFGECMKNLSELYLDGTAITELPSSLGCLVGLTILSLTDCKNLVCLPEFGECMKNLEGLYLDGTAITELPSSLGCLVGLTILSLKYCKNLVCLPEFGECMKNLSELYLGGTAITELPSSLGCLVGLTILSLKYCKNLVRPPNSISKLPNFQSLNIVT